MPPIKEQRLETAAIERFLSLVKRAAQARSKDVRLDIADATALAAELSILLLKSAHPVTPTAQPLPLIDVAWDGGDLHG